MVGTTPPPVRERHEIVDERRSPMPWILGILAVVALVIVLFFALGGDADADGEPGDVDLPELDVDVDAPDVDLEAPDIDVDPGDVDIEEGDAEAEAG